MRINKYIAHNTGLSRRVADELINAGKVAVNGIQAKAGQNIKSGDIVEVNDEKIKPQTDITIMLNKPVGYVCSRQGQGNKTIYDLLPKKYENLKYIGRLDKNSSGLILLTSDGDLAHELTHPGKEKIKRYEISINMPLQPLHQQLICDYGVKLEDGISKLQLSSLENSRLNWTVLMSEGRNRQIRRTFKSLGYEIESLHRTNFANYEIGDLKPGEIREI